MLSVRTDIKEEKPIDNNGGFHDERDGRNQFLLRKLRSSIARRHLIMISKYPDKSLVNQAYDAGVEFFVSKPINVLEIEHVPEYN